jgi:leader peptidase (prepilin peptidase)/N-methyltransferase
VVLLLVLVGALGLAIGSFLNVVIHRVPAGLSVVSPASRCPDCGTPIRARHNVPVVGWLLLRGRCASCQRPISVRYPLVEALTGVLFVLVTWRVLQLDQAPVVPALLTFTALGVALSAIDLDLRRLPDALVLPAYPLLTALLAAAAGVGGDWASLGRALLGAAVLFGCFLALALIHPAGMGFGDVKFSGVIGLVLGWFSWTTLVVGAFAGFFLGALVGLVVLAVSPLGRKAEVPFGPFMVAGALLALWVTDPLLGVLTYR